MKVYIYKLKFNGPTHFGDTGIDLEYVSEWVNSDTLFSALANALSSIEGSKAVKEFINSFHENPPFLISSLFLYSKDNCFLPKPLYDDHIDLALKKDLGKDLKKLKWLDVEGFKKWTGRDGITKNDIEKMKYIQAEYKNSFYIEIRPRVTLDRSTQNSSIYHAG
ncbi:MAG: type III-A CRISPR-associated RAMP protein Csm4, partial [Thermodesulfovibrionales bacterium]